MSVWINYGMPFRLFHFNAIWVLALLPSLSLAGNEKPSCADLARSQEHHFSEPVQKWLDWELTPSIPGFHQEFPSSRLPLSLVSLREVTMTKSSHLPKEVAELFLRDQKVLWPKHPYNTVETTPFFKAPELTEKMKAYHTASRSMVTEIGGKVYGIKMPTNHPFGPSRVEQINKAFPKDSMRSSMRRTEIIEKVDQKIGMDPDLILLKDILTVTETHSGHGFSIRDLTALSDGHYYFPAHQIPVLGAEIAAKNGQTLSEFFKANWASALGKFQAKMLVRYGIEFNPINPQNFLIQLDRDFKPTGRLACRDLGDSFQVESITTWIGMQDELAREKELGLKTFAKADPGTKSETLTWGFNLTGKEMILPVTREAWYSAHDAAFIAELERLTGITVPRGYGVYAIDPFLEKPENKAALLRFHQK